MPVVGVEQPVPAWKERRWPPQGPAAKCAVACGTAWPASRRRANCPAGSRAGRGRPRACPFVVLAGSVEQGDGAAALKKAPMARPWGSFVLPALRPALASRARPGGVRGPRPTVSNPAYHRYGRRAACPQAAAGGCLLLVFLTVLGPPQAGLLLCRWWGSNSPCRRRSVEKSPPWPCHGGRSFCRPYARLWRRARAQAGYQVAPPSFSSMVRYCSSAALSL